DFLSRFELAAFNCFHHGKWQRLTTADCRWQMANQFAIHAVSCLLSAIGHLQLVIARSALSRDEPVIRQRLAAHKAPQLPRLHFPPPPIRHFVTDLRMTHFRIESPKPRFPEWPAALVTQKSSIRAFDEIFRTEFAAIDETDGN